MLAAVRPNAQVRALGARRRVAPGVAPWPRNGESAVFVGAFEYRYPRLNGSQPRSDSRSGGGAPPPPTGPISVTPGLMRRRQIITL